MKRTTKILIEKLQKANGETLNNYVQNLDIQQVNSMLGIFQTKANAQKDEVLNKERDVKRCKEAPNNMTSLTVVALHQHAKNKLERTQQIVEILTLEQEKKQRKKQ